MSLPSGPVDEVRSVAVLGAKVMEGTWPNGETGVLISTSVVDPIDARMRYEEGELR